MIYSALLLAGRQLAATRWRLVPGYKWLISRRVPIVQWQWSRLMPQTLVELLSC